MLKLDFKNKWLCRFEVHDCTRDSSLDIQRSVFENPKQNQKVTIEPGIKDSFVTPYWLKKIYRFFRSRIASHIEENQQLWIYTTEELAKFIDELTNDKVELKGIEYVCIVCAISDIYDIVDFFTKLRDKLPDEAKVILCNYNWKWEWIFKFSGYIGFSKKRPWGNFYRDDDLDCFLDMSGWERVQKIGRYIVPFDMGWISVFLDGIFKLPILRSFTLITVFLARKKVVNAHEDYSISILIPCKNEEDNIKAIVNRVPEFGKSIELIFINDKSTDATEERIIQSQREFPAKNIKLVQGVGIGKGEAVRTGMREASGDICMILDADMSIIPEDLPQFYEVMKFHRADFVHGTRMVYHQEQDAMRPANIFGNIAFSILFSYILEQRVTDTLCGTKVFWRRDWPMFEDMRQLLKNRDLWGDYNLIFGAARFGLKIGELPVRYYQRLEGFTKMSRRIKNALIMARVSWHALWEIKFAG